MDLLLLSLVLLLITFSSLLMFAASSAHRGSLFDNADLVKMVFCLSLLKEQSITISSFFQNLNSNSKSQDHTILVRFAELIGVPVKVMGPRLQEVSNQNLYLHKEVFNNQIYHQIMGVQTLPQDFLQHPLHPGEADCRAQRAIDLRGYRATCNVEGHKRSM